MNQRTQISECPQDIDTNIFKIRLIAMQAFLHEESLEPTSILQSGIYVSYFFDYTQLRFVSTIIYKADANPEALQSAIDLFTYVHSLINRQ
jgi:hypothetical protein